MKQLPIPHQMLVLRDADKPEVLLWISVIARMLDDAVYEQSSQTQDIQNKINVSAEIALHADQARDWFNVRNEEFLTVCDYAGLDPSTVCKRACDIIHEFDATIRVSVTTNDPIATRCANGDQRIDRQRAAAVIAAQRMAGADMQNLTQQYKCSRSMISHAQYLNTRRPKTGVKIADSYLASNRVIDEILKNTRKNNAV